MKFGSNLPRNQVPEWASNYINYKALKKLIKSAAETAKHGGVADTAGFLHSLDRNLEDVDVFYNKKYGEAARRLKLLQDRYGKPTDIPDGIDKDEVEDLMGALLELRGQLRKLQWYGEVNRRGFIKITKKLDKKVPQATTQRLYLESKVDPKPFTTNVGLLDTMKTVNDWLSVLGDLKIPDDSSSTHSSSSMRHVSSKAILNLPAGLLDTVDQAIRNDDASILMELLQEANVGQESPEDPLFQRLLLNLLQRSVSCKAKTCIDKLLEQLITLDDEEDIHKRNCIHRLVIAIGRSRSSGDAELTADPSLAVPLENMNYITPAAPPILTPQVCLSKETDGAARLGRTDKSIVLLQYLLDKLRPQQRTALQAKDIYGRMPLHYAAQYGIVVICQIIIASMQNWGQFEVTEGIDAPIWQDTEGLAPLHLSVIGGHPLTTKTLLEAEDWRGANDHKAAVRRQMSKSSAILALATKANFVVIVKLLVDAGVDINYQDEQQGETALHVAARCGHTEIASVLLEGSKDQTVNTELTEKTFGWTPLFFACVDGHLGVVDLLIDAGADLQKMDLSGWTAKEHAALRGHMHVANRLAEVTAAPEISGSETSSATDPPSPPSPSSFVADRTSNASVNGNVGVRITEPVKTFGHRYLTKECMILVSLGSMDMRKAIEAVKLDRIPLAEAHSTQLDTALSVVVSASGANGDPSIIDLPVQDNISTDPIVFTAVDATKVKLLFDIIPTYAGTKDQIVGRGVALLSSIRPNVGSKRISLQGDVTVPIMAANTLDVIGSVNFNFLTITPFTHPNMSVTENQTYWKSMTSTMLIGHRGLGKNRAARTSLQLGENTIQSFIAAANLGASYVEFDVQLTKDHVPVIYHDFLVSETGIDAPVHTLTLEQFLHISDARTPRSSRPASPAPLMDPSIKDLRGPEVRRQRSLSVGNGNKDGVSEMSERMKHTRDFKQKGFKGNSRGNFIQAPFTTLEEMFMKLPETIGFNIEMKYPMLHESEEQEMDTYAVELNSFVDTVLTKVYDLGRKRNIIFSSFNPDICLLLSFKQPSIPILFLTDAGTSPVGDIRASSLQEAIRFASRWNLLGVVSAAEPFVISPRLVKVVKESGLVCVSYGTINNDPAKVKLQVKEGIDAVIVDSVLAIRKGLTGHESSAPSSASGACTPSSNNGSGSSSNGV
ncbi:MAG: glycerophosphodiester phosphodiesterase gde1 [Lasallia pustulata]|uniref:Glycerophosphodiester phosphodiesterase gde1 n=1 Tax=Lasallia pustulata TaxID=136370 RepID=A0A5M8PCG7_9LECA|nr:MAG: glycerophosphodiester phosphodiesterase gde1 [Lasallia pustulata]